jgi:putative membrane protein
VIETKYVMVVCVDRDNDLGRKANVLGPIIGRKNNLNAAAKLGIADPGESDVNCIFGAIRKFDEVKKFYSNVEIVTLTGVGKQDFESDKELNEQLDKVLADFPAEAFVLVTDGAEDDQVIPILQSRAHVMSKETIIIKQASEVESTYYTIKEALNDPYLARIVFGVPGIILVSYYLFGGFSLQIISLILGVYLLLKGFGIEEKIISTSRNFFQNISISRASFIFYVGSLFIFAFGLYQVYTAFTESLEINLFLKSISSLQETYFVFLFLVPFSFLIGKSIDAIHFKKAFYLRNYLMYAVSTILLWFILDTGTLVLIGQSDLIWFISSMISSFVILLAAYNLSSVFDVRKKVTELLVGLPVYEKGRIIGNVEKINRKEKSIFFMGTKEKELTKLTKTKFKVQKGKIILS